MRVIGITGLIASGKSEVTRYLRDKGYCVVCADEVSHDISRKGCPGYDAIVAAFGAEYLRDDGEIDRKKLGDMVFADPAQLNRLNEAVWPIIRTEIKLRSKGFELSFLDAALLIEADMLDEVDELWVINAPREVRIARLMERNGFDEAEACLRVNAQSDEKIKLARANVIIDNSGTKEELYAKVDEALLALADEE